MTLFRMFTRAGAVATLSLSLLATDARASEPVEADAHAQAGGHGAAEGEHAAEGDHGKSGGAHGGHHYYTADDDGDGSANWSDSDSELFVLDDVGFHAFNVTLLLAVLFALSRRVVGDTLKERALGIRKELTDSAKTREDAQGRYKAIEGRLAALSAEVDAMRVEARKEAEVEAAKLIERARAEATRIGETAERNIRDEITRAQQDLRREAVELAVQLAEATLREAVSADDRQRLARDFLDSLNQSEVASA